MWEEELMTKAAYYVAVLLLFVGAQMFVSKVLSLEAQHYTWIVDDDGDADFSTIQEAVNSADEGDTILVKEGTYLERVVVNKSLSIVGESRYTTIVDANLTGLVLQVTADNAVVANLTLTRSEPAYGCVYVNSSHNILDNNIITENWYGLYFFNCRNSSARYNVLTHNKMGIYCFEVFGLRFEGNIIADNSAQGLMCRGTNNCTFEANAVRDNGGGFDFVSSSFNQLVENDIAENGRHGVRMEDYSYHNVLDGNNITGQDSGIWTHVSHQNMIVHNTIAYNEQGFTFNGYPSVLQNTVHCNTIVNNSVGVYLWHTELNNFSMNNFINNSVQMLSDGSSDQWDEGYPSGGNYWSDYNGTDLCGGAFQNETGADAIGDTPYLVSPSPQMPEFEQLDHYPLMGMFSEFDAAPECQIRTICNSTIYDYQFNGTALAFRVSDKSGTSTFCRICIPTALMGDTFNVYVNGTEVASTVLPCSTAELAYLHFDLADSSDEVVIVPEDPWILVSPLLAGGLLAAVRVRSRRLVHQRMPSE